MEDAGNPQRGSRLEALNRLQIHSLRFRFNAEAGASLHMNLAATWRAALGPALAVLAPDVHRVMYEPDRSASLPARFPSVPPYALAAPGTSAFQITCESSYELQMTLFGSLGRSSDVIVDAVAAAGAEGLGQDRVPMNLTSAEASAFALGDVPVPACPAAARVVFVSPQRLRGPKGSKRYMNAEEFQAREWVSTVQRRASLLSAAFADAEYVEPAIPDRIAFHEAGIADVAQARSSSRQNRLVDMSGLVGSFLLPLGSLERFWPELWYSQWLQTGATTTAGNGVVRLHPVAI